MNIENISTLVALLVALSVASERLVDIIKGVVPFLNRENLDANGWRIRDGNNWMLLANDLNDALAVLRIVERYTRMCFVGRNNTRPNRKQYIMTYWE